MRKLGKKSTLKRYYKQPSQSIKTNLEKKTQEKINTMSSNDTLTMDFVLKNRKLLEHLKKCKVFLSKSMRKNLLKKYALLNNPISRKIKHGKVIIARKGKRGRPKKIQANPPLLNGLAVKEEVNGVTASPPSLRASRAMIAAAQTSQQIKNSSSPQTPRGGKQKAAASGEIVQSPGPIFIRLPPKNSKRTIHKRQIFGKSIDKATLIRRFGKVVFKCHVRVKRLRKSDPIFTRKLKTNRKTVSFMETVEVFGESDAEFESDKSINTSKNVSSKMARTSTPLRGGKKQTKQNKQKSPKVLSKSQVRQLKTTKESVNKQTKSVTQNTKSPRKSASPKNATSPRKSTSPQKVISPVKAKSPQKKTPSPEKKKPASPEKKKTASPEKKKSPISPKKARSPKKKEQQTDAIRRSLINGKECYVKLNRNSTSLLSLSTTSIENGDADESRVEDLTMDESEIVYTTIAEPSKAQEENEAGSEVFNGSSANGVAVKPGEDDVEMSEQGIEQNEHQATIDEEANAENNLEAVRLENEAEPDESNKAKDECNIEEDGENNEAIDPAEDAAPMEESNIDKDTDNIEGDINEEMKEVENPNEEETVHSDDNVELEQVENSENVNNDDGGVGGDNEKDIQEHEVLVKDDELNEKECEETVVDKLNGNDVDDISESIGAENLPATVDESKDEQDNQVSEKRVSTPVYKRGKFDKIDRGEGRAVSSSPLLSGTKTNGTKQKSDTISTLPDNSEDLFDLLKSNKLPENESSSKRIPSPTPDLSDDEAELAGDFNKDAQSPVADIAEESGSSANDSRFSLNTFFKSKNRSGNEDPAKSPSNADEINLKNSECNLDSPGTQEITIQ